MWACLDPQGECTTESTSTAYLPALECGLRHSNLQNIPSDVIMHIFTFSDIIDYVCSISLGTEKFKLLRDLMYNSLKMKIQHIQRYSMTKEDLLYEMETSIAHALLNTEPWILHIAIRNKHSKIRNNCSYPPQCLYFSVNKDYRRVSYFYLLHYIYLYKFGLINVEIIIKMYVLLERIVFTGCILCCGFMMELYYLKFGINDTKYCKINILNKRYWKMVCVMFIDFYATYDEHLQHKPLSVAQETVLNFVKMLSSFTRIWNYKKVWMYWIETYPNNQLNRLLMRATAFYS